MSLASVCFFIRFNNILNRKDLLYGKARDIQHCMGRGFNSKQVVG